MRAWHFVYGTAWKFIFGRHGAGRSSTRLPLRYFIAYAVLYLIWSAVFYVSGLRCDGERYIYETRVPASSPSTPVAATPQRTQAQLEEI